MIQSDAETSHGRSLLSVMFSPRDSTQLATAGDGGAQVIDIRADPNKYIVYQYDSFIITITIQHDDILIQ